MGKRLVAGLSLVFLSLSCWTAPVMAHFEAGNNGVQAVMHIVPDDNPTAGRPTLIDFSMTGTAPDFSVTTCQCQIQVSKDSKSVASAFIEPADQTNTNGQVSVTFPEQGVYDLKLIGLTAVHKFAISYVVRVNPAGGTANTAAGINVLMVSLASLAVVSVLAYYNISKGGRYNTHKGVS